MKTDLLKVQIHAVGDNLLGYRRCAHPGDVNELFNLIVLLLNIAQTNIEDHRVSEAAYIFEKGKVLVDVDDSYIFIKCYGCGENYVEFEIDIAEGDIENINFSLTTTNTWLVYFYEAFINDPIDIKPKLWIMDEDGNLYEMI